MRHAFLNDLTKQDGNISQVIAVIREYAARYNPSVIEWVARNDQRSFLGTDIIHEDYLDPGLPSRIRALVHRMSLNGASGSTIHVLSFEGFVLSAVSALNGPDVVLWATPSAPSKKKRAGFQSGPPRRRTFPRIIP